MPDFFIHAALGFVIGAVLGSFINALAYRLPRGISMITPRSSCPSCRAVLRPRDLVPMLSWLASRGRCNHCGAAIGRRYFYVELAMAAASAAIFALLWDSWLLLPAIITAVILATKIVITMEKQNAAPAGKPASRANGISDT